MHAQAADGTLPEQGFDIGSICVLKGIEWAPVVDDLDGQGVVLGYEDDLDFRILVLDFPP